MAVRNGNIVLSKGFGYADKEAGRLNTASTIFGLGSIPIDFTIAAILKLEDDGILSLSDPVSTFFSNAPADKSGLDAWPLIVRAIRAPEFPSSRRCR